MAELCPRAKFCRNRSNRGRHMAIFRFFKMAAAAILYFSNIKFLTVRRLRKAELRRRAKFRWSCSKRGQDMVIFRFSSLARKRLFTPQNCLFFWGGGFDPLNGRHINETPKRHILGQKDVIWRIDRQNRSTGATCARDEETKKRQRKKPNSGKLAIRRDHPRCRIEMESCMVGGLRIVVLSFEFHQNRLSGFRAVGVEICPSPLTWPLVIQQLVLPYKPW